MGVDTRTPVDDRDYQVPFRLTGKLAKLTVKLGRPQPPPEIVEIEMERAVQLERARDERAGSGGRRHWHEWFWTQINGG